MTVTAVETQADYRSDLAPGDIVRGKYGNLARLVSWNGTWSHLTGGRIAVLEPLRGLPGHPDAGGCASVRAHELVGVQPYPRGAW